MDKPIKKKKVALDLQQLRDLEKWRLEKWNYIALRRNKLDM